MTSWKSVSRGTLCMALLIMVLPTPGYAQSRERSLNWFEGAQSPDVKVLEIMDIKVEGKSVVIGHSFAAGKDWFKSLVFRVRNISTKPVKIFVLTLNIPELDKDGRKHLYDMPYGIGKMGVRSNESDVWEPVNPGEVVELVFNGALLKTSLHEAVEQNNVGVSRVNIYPTAILTFNDGSYERGGMLVR